jgi:hypothetical protein
MATIKSKLQMEYNKEVILAAPGLLGIKQLSLTHANVSINDSGGFKAVFKKFLHKFPF